MSNKKIILASNNKGKIREIQEILSPLGYEIISMKDSGIDIDIEENGKTFKENAGIKARAIYENLIRLTDNEEVLQPLLFLRQREIVHYQRFKELLEHYKKMGY